MAALHIDGKFRCPRCKVFREILKSNCRADTLHGPWDQPELCLWEARSPSASCPQTPPVLTSAWGWRLTASLSRLYSGFVHSLILSCSEQLRNLHSNYWVLNIHVSGTTATTLRILMATFAYLHLKHASFWAGEIFPSAPIHRFLEIKSKRSPQDYASWSPPTWQENTKHLLLCCV